MRIQSKYMQIAGSLAVAVSSIAITACGGSEYRRQEGMVWHTTYHATYESDRDLGDSIISALNRVDASLNAFDESSLVSRINSGATSDTDEDFICVYRKSEEVNRLSAGAFDPTLGPLITAWGFGKGHAATADTLRIDSLLAFTGMNKTRLEGGKLIKDDPRTEFNFSAIAKGYGCDKVAEMLERNGVENYLIEIGGEIRCGGKNPTGGVWRISIDRPIRSDSVVHESECIMELTDCGMATSGNYRNYHGSGAAAYGHTISSTTGRPALTDVLSATVISPTSMEADAWATALMAMGSNAAKETATKLDLKVMLILNDMEVWNSPAMTKLQMTGRTGALACPK